MKGICVELSDILAEFHLHQVILQHFQLEIYLSVVVGQYRDAIIELIGVRVSSVVD